MKTYKYRSQGFLLSVVFLCAALTGCSGLGPKRAAPATTSAPTVPPPSVQTNSAPPVTSPPAPLTAETLEPKVEIYPGSGTFVGGTPNRHRAETTIGEQGNITLNFVAADIRDVAKAVLGDYLNLNYEIAANVQGSITIQTSRPLSKSQVLPVLEQALRLNGMVLVHSNGIYKVMPLADAQGTSGPLTPRESKTPGYGIEIAPVRFISAAEMQKLLGPLAPSQAVIHVDAARNILIVEGTEQERQAILDDVALFDADWLEGMSYALYTPNYIDVDELTRELNQILGGLNSPIGNLVKLIPIERLNTVLAISPQTKYLEQLKAWVKRLDRPGEGSDRRVFVYQVQNGRAGDLAATLVKLMHGGLGASTPSGTPNGGFPAMEPRNSGVANAPGLGPSMVTTEQQTMPENSTSGAGGIAITADETNNALLILASPQEYSAVEASIRKLDAAPLQVYLEAAIAEVTLTNDLQYGVQYFYQPGGQHQLTLSDTKSSTIASAFPGFSYMFTRGTNIKVILDALSSITHVEVSSSPQLMVLNNQTATLQVGDRVPIATEQAVGVTTSNPAIVNSIQYQDTGVILKVTPRVNHGGLVMMDISQEVSEVANTTSSNIDSPTIQERKISSSVAVQDGQTIALGGLIMDNRTKGKSGIPFVQQIPLIGDLLGDNTDNRTRTELMVLITPHVVENMEQARTVTDELRKKLPEVQPLFERVR